MTEGTARTEHSQRLFDRAVRRERDAIVLHERAGAMHEATAVLLEQAALTALHSPRADQLRGRAAAERDLARLARDRAAGVRARLIAEGVPDVG